MKDYERENKRFSLCGLNCGLCPMFIGNHCGGCGSGNHSCKIAKCSIEHGKLEYCFECKCYPCERYEHIDEYDSFITHKRQKADIEKAKVIGIDAYNAEQQEKEKILRYLLANYNDERKKNFYCIAVNLMELSDIKGILNQTKFDQIILFMSIKDRCSYLANLFKESAKRTGIEIKLNKKK